MTIAKDWRAPTRKLDRQALYFFNPAGAVTLLVLVAFVSLLLGLLRVRHCPLDGPFPSPSNAHQGARRKVTPSWRFYLALRLGMSLLFFHTSSRLKSASDRWRHKWSARCFGFPFVYFLRATANATSIIDCAQVSGRAESSGTYNILNGWTAAGHCPGTPTWIAFATGVTRRRCLSCGCPRQLPCEVSSRSGPGGKLLFPPAGPM